MSQPPTSPASPAGDLQAAWRDGGRALREGRPAEALALFSKITGSGGANGAVWLGVAMAQRALGDRPAERDALEAALRLEPRNPHALMMMGDHHAAADDSKAASAFYDAVVKLAAATPADAALQAEATRARQMLAGYAETYGAHLRQALNGRGLDGRGLEAPQARRARKALDLLTGRSRLYLQEPKHFYFPELPNIEWAERADFPWLDRVEAATDDIRAELARVIEEDGAFSPYVKAEANRPVFDSLGLLDNPQWSAFFLWKDGEPVAGNVERFPKTMAALADAPLCKIPGRTPSILFSLLRPGAHIPPHHGFMNARYICHLPLIVPENCAMRVGAETRPWVEGQACVFDDSIEHEAWNRNADKLRVVLIFDIWRPELTDLERELIAATLEAVDAYGGKRAWTE